MPGCGTRVVFESSVETRFIQAKAPRRQRLSPVCHPFLLLVVCRRAPTLDPVAPVRMQVINAGADKLKLGQTACTRRLAP